MQPALALAGELKVPTGESPLIGSDQFDYSAYAIASKRFGRLAPAFEFYPVFLVVGNFNGGSSRAGRRR